MTERGRGIYRERKQTDKRNIWMGKTRGKGGNEIEEKDETKEGENEDKK